MREAPRGTALLAALVAALALHAPDSGLAGQQPLSVLHLGEPAIADLRAAMTAGRLTCRQLVQQYLDRIEAYDKRGPALNSIIMVNPRALAGADELDAALARGGPTGPLHCIPVIVKDNYDTADMPTTAGSLTLAGSIPPDDAFQVRRVREAGAIVLAKANMAEFAFSPYETVSSILPGYTKNPYALDRVTAGSSGGTAAAVAANFGAVGLGTDTGNSIRGPSSHNSLVGIRSTIGLTSRDGIVPVNAQDVGGPMARTVADAAAILDVIAGHDPADPTTAASEAHRPASYSASLVRDGLRGARIGVLRWFIDDTADPEVVRLFDRALADMAGAGARIVDPVLMPDYEAVRTSGPRCGDGVKFFLNRYLAGLGPRAPVKSMQEILESRKFHPSILDRLENAQAIAVPPEDDPQCAGVFERQRRLREVVMKALAAHDVEVLAYPTWNNPPRLIGDLNSPHGNNSPRLAPATGFPAITVPMGFTHGTLPAGLQLLGPAWSEPTLFRIAYAYEQLTHHRRPPATVPPLW